MTSSITATVLSQIPPLPSRKIPIKSLIFPSFVSTKEHKTRKGVPLQRSNGATASTGSGSPAGLYSAQELELELELNPQNVDTVLEEVRPYLIADGGNVDVVSVEDGVISLKFQGACGTCPSSTTTMKMGIERILKEKFGKAVEDILKSDVVLDKLHMERNLLRRPSKITSLVNFCMYI